jgi:hypothetical protein
LNPLQDLLLKPHIYYHDGRWRSMAAPANRFFMSRWWGAMADDFCRNRNPPLEEHCIVIVEVEAR